MLKDNCFILGYKVFVTPDQPKMQLSEGCPVTDAVRAEVNAWMVRFFGVDNLVKDGEYTINTQLGFIYMNPRTFNMFKENALFKDVV